MNAHLFTDSTDGRAPVGRRWFFGVLAVLVVCAAVLVGASAVALYGMGWSERRLAPVRLGMTEAEVRAAAGDPRVVTPDAAGGGHWSYTRWWSADADVYFDATGRVRAVVTD